jgi:hypothetical protein
MRSESGAWRLASRVGWILAAGSLECGMERRHQKYDRVAADSQILFRLRIFESGLLSGWPQQAPTWRLKESCGCSKAADSLKVEGSTARFPVSGSRQTKPRPKQPAGRMPASRGAGILPAGQNAYKTRLPGNGAHKKNQHPTPRYQAEGSMPSINNLCDLRVLSQKKRHQNQLTKLSIPKNPMTQGILTWLVLQPFQG